MTSWPDAARARLAGSLDHLWAFLTERPPQVSGRMIAYLVEGWFPLPEEPIPVVLGMALQSWETKEWAAAEIAQRYRYVVQENGRRARQRGFDRRFPIVDTGAWVEMDDARLVRAEAARG